MKKIFIVFIVALLPLGMFAQQDSTITTPTNNLVSKHGVPILPQAGDFAIGVDALPYINFFGRFFSGSNELQIGDNNTLYGKYYLDNNTAVRVEVYTSHVNATDRNYVVDDAANLVNPNSLRQVGDILNTNEHEYGIGVGIQKYRGYGRLRGTYGGQISYYRSKTTEDFTWGNEMNALNPTPTSTNWSDLRNAYNPASRTMKGASGVNNSIAVTALAGVEYFFLPKVCIGGEVGISMLYSKQGQSNYTFEQVQDLSGTPTRIEMDRAVSPGDSEFSIQTWQYGAPAGRIYVLFHF